MGLINLVTRPLATGTRAGKPLVSRKELAKAQQRVFSQVSQAVTGNRLMARALRSTSWIVLGYGGSQAIRLAS
ncbi:hypothetical protein, partial [Sulfitobacter sp. HI0076]|uniref:hypothetical protein n=1 Tax=Sulfitobacter sp. HI0076 TaxID=1822251 RepID=UPI00123745DE